MQKRAQLLPPVSCLDMRNRDRHSIKEKWLTDHDLKDKEMVLSHSIPYASFPVVAEFFCLEFRETTPLIVIMCLVW